MYFKNIRLYIAPLFEARVFFKNLPSCGSISSLQIKESSKMDYCFGLILKNNIPEYYSLHQQIMQRERRGYRGKGSPKIEGSISFFFTRSFFYWKKGIGSFIITNYLTGLEKHLSPKVTSTWLLTVLLFPFYSPADPCQEIRFHIMGLSCF